MPPEYDSDLQAAVDSTSVVKDTGETDLLETLREQLAERDIKTDDQEWLKRMVEGIRGDRNFMIDSEPNDYDPQR